MNKMKRTFLFLILSLFSMTFVYAFEGWGESTPEKYVIEEERYADTGDRYYDINFGCNSFNISKLVFVNCRGKVQKAKIGDKYPWN